MSSIPAEVASLVENGGVAWRCTSEDNIWMGTEIRFSLEAQHKATVVRFDHTGWGETTDTFRECAMTWAYFMESLRLCLETGKGTPESIAPPCELEHE